MYPLLIVKLPPIAEGYSSAIIASQNIHEARLAELGYSRDNEGFRAVTALAFCWFERRLDGHFRPPAYIEAGARRVSQSPVATKFPAIKKNAGYGRKFRADGGFSDDRQTSAVGLQSFCRQGGEGRSSCHGMSRALTIDLSVDDCCTRSMAGIWTRTRTLVADRLSADSAPDRGDSKHVRITGLSL